MHFDMKASEVRALARKAEAAILQFREASEYNRGARLGQLTRVRGIHACTVSLVAQQKVTLNMDDWLALTQLPGEPI